MSDIPPRPVWAHRLKTDYFNGHQEERHLCIRVRPSKDNPASKGADFAVAGLEFDDCRKIEAQWRKQHEEFTRVEGCSQPFEIKKDVLRVKGGRDTYELLYDYIPLIPRSATGWVHSEQDYLRSYSKEGMYFLIKTKEGLWVAPDNTIQLAMFKVWNNWKIECGSMSSWTELEDIDEKTKTYVGSMYLDPERCRLKVEKNVKDKKTGKEKRDIKIFPVTLRIAPRMLQSPYDVDKPKPAVDNPRFKVSGLEWEAVDKIPESVERGTEYVIFNCTQSELEEFIRYRCVEVSETNDLEYYEREGNRLKKKGVLLSEKESSKIKTSEGWYLWFYEDPSQDYSQAREIRKVHRVVPCRVEDSDKFEEALLRGEETVAFNGGSHLGYIVTSKMYQEDIDKNSRRRRLGRLGVHIRSDLEDLWKDVHHFRDISVEVPRDWRFRTPGKHGLVQLNPDDKEYVMIMNFVQRNVQESNGPENLRGIGGTWLEKSKETLSDTLPPTVHFIDSDGNPQKKPVKALHIAGIFRFENPNMFLTYQTEKNKVLCKTSEGTKPLAQNASRYLAENPLYPPVDEVEKLTDKLEERVNEHWFFSGHDAEFIYYMLLYDTEKTNRAAAESCSFMRGSYFTPVFVKALKYAGCPKCGKSQRSGSKVSEKCECGARNLLRPYVVLLSRVILGNVLFVRDRPTLRLYGQLCSFDPPKPKFDTDYPIVVCYDDHDVLPERYLEKEEFKRLNPKGQYTEDMFCPVPANLSSVTDFSKDFARPRSDEDDQYTQLCLFYVKSATLKSPGFHNLMEYLRKSRDNTMESTTMKEFFFGFVVDDNAEQGALDLAKELSGELIKHGAQSCFYHKKEKTAEMYFKDCKTPEDFIKLFKEEFHTIPDKGLTLELPDIVCDSGEDRVDSIFVEDTGHCSPEIAQKYPMLKPSLFDSRQNRNREVVVFKPGRMYAEYAILVYEYESVEAMKKYMNQEYPHDSHGKEDPSPLFFLDPDQRETDPNPINRENDPSVIEDKNLPDECLEVKKF